MSPWVEYSIDVPMLLWHWVEYSTAIPLLPQVDPHCMNPRYTGVDMPWQKVVTDAQGSVTELQNPALLIASIVFHPCNWGDLWTEAKKKEVDGERVIEHPFTADKALEAQQVVEYSRYMPCCCSWAWNIPHL